MAGKRYTFVLNFGYVESSRLSYMPWVSRNNYKDAKEALVDLAEFLKEHFLREHGETEPKKCCVETRAKDPEANFCSKCGRDLQEQEFHEDNFCEWLHELCDSNIDSFHGYVDYDRESRWKAGDLEGAPNQRFVYEAELVLSAAAGYPYNKEKTFEVICKERTKSRKDSFSYY